ncbi:hypothetical protein [Spirillospora sp. NBC_01491]|uniref:hypothetical protein n=1 Tax=Spirillospora sp. NBC_01491 TaxID=2976007 RepID=UPI002E32692B|nr:hypothetical protein [Spirillospora sp. NBC_01491]
MTWGLLGAFAAAVCFGLGTALQAAGARTAVAAHGTGPRMLIRLTTQLPFLAGLTLDLLGFAAELGALRALPLFVVQAVVAGELAVTALAAGPLLKIHITRREGAAIALVCAGLVLLGISSGHEGPAHVPATLRWTLPAAAAALVLLGAAATRLTGRTAAAALGAIAGLGFGLVSISVRVMTSLAPLELLRDPATYALAAGGTAAFAFYATALGRGSVTPTIAALVVAQTAVPAGIGVWLLGDRSRPGFAPVAITGFTLAVLATLTLTRFGEPEPRPRAEPGGGPAPATGRTPDHPTGP